MISVSIVSHAHGDMVERLVEALLSRCADVSEVLVTRNVPEVHSGIVSEQVKYIYNASPKGFGSNHNAAFALSRAPFFCVMNPDVRLLADPFPPLIRSLARKSAVLAAPVVRSSEGELEDSIRRFPSVSSLLTKIILGRRDEYVFGPSCRELFPEWVAGMFMLFVRDGYERLGGFDESFHMYYEDVDICTRAWMLGLAVVVSLESVVIHDAQRASHSSLRHFVWHVSSAARYLMRHSSRLQSIRGGMRPDSA